MKEFFTIPNKCPKCDGDLVVDGAFLVCNNIECDAKAIGILIKWITALDIRDIGKERVRMFFEAGILKTPADLYRLSVEDISPIERMGEKSALKILKQIEAKKKISLAKFIEGLNIEGVSLSTGELLVNNGYDTLSMIQEVSLEELVKIKGIAEIVGLNIIEGIKSRKDIIDDLLTVIEIEAKKEVGSKLKDMSFCVTGTLPTKERKEIEQMIKDNGGEVRDSVSKKLHYLIVGVNAGSKLDKANSLGVKILSEEEFMNLL